MSQFINFFIQIFQKLWQFWESINFGGISMAAIIATEWLIAIFCIAWFGGPPDDD